jgi:hypothetical protein
MDPTRELDLFADINDAKDVAAVGPIHKREPSVWAIGRRAQVNATFDENANRALLGATGEVPKQSHDPRFRLDYHSPGGHFSFDQDESSWRTRAKT